MAKRTALAIMRTQPLHKGHTGIADIMTGDYDTVIIGCGSADKPISIGNPFPIEIRMQMWRNIYGDRIKLVPLADLGATRDTNEWCDYVLKKITGMGLPAPTDYFTGSPADAIWYRGRFFNKECGSPADDNAEDFMRRYMPNGVFRQLHLVDRVQNYIPSATAVNHSIVEENFPEDFKVDHGDS